MKGGRVIHGARTIAGVTQPRFAKRVGTTQPVTTRLEEVEDRSHSLSTLQLIVHVLHG